MTPARNSPSTRTLGSQLVVMSTVLALIARILRTARSPTPLIVRSRNATTEMILARIESLDSMAKVLLFLSARALWGRRIGFRGNVAAHQNRGNLRAR